MPASVINFPTNSEGNRPAPRLPATRGSLAALAARPAPLWARLKFQLGLMIAALEPWYEWGPAGISSVRDETGGDGWYFTIDWLGLHLSIMGGRTPKQVRS